MAVRAVLIERSWIAAVQIAGRDRVWVATDDPGIAAVVRGFGGQVVMTPGTCRNGTERCAAALAVLGDIAPIVVNFQGDAPLTPGHVVPDLVAALVADPECGDGDGCLALFAEHVCASARPIRRRGGWGAPR